jgi:hypothetical protein
VHTPSGWYPDTTRPNTERYWDGRAWTEQARFPGVRPFESAVPPALADPQVMPPVVSMFETSTVGYSLPRDEGAIPEGAKAEPAQMHRPRRPTVLKSSPRR